MLTIAERIMNISKTIFLLNWKSYAKCGLSQVFCPFSEVLLVENNMQVQIDKRSKQMQTVHLHKQLLLKANKWRAVIEILLTTGKTWLFKFKFPS